MDKECLDCNKSLRGNSNPKRCKGCANKKERNPMYGKENKWGKHSEESKRKMSESQKGRIVTIETRKKISENNTHYWLGKKRPIDYIVKGVKTRFLNNSYKQSLETKKKISEKNKGEKGSNWKGGITPLNKLLRNSYLWKSWRNKVFLRDNFICQNIDCGFCENKRGSQLHPHHIKQLHLYPQFAFDVNNGITYCGDFHLKGGLHKK